MTGPAASVVLAPALALWLRSRLGLPAESSRARGGALLLVLAALAFVLLEWTRAPRLFGEDFPLPLPAARALALQAAGVGLSAAAFSLAGRGAGLGAVYGLALAPLGWSASRWPSLCRAVELSGGVFLGPLLLALLRPALAAGAAFAAEALANPRWRPHAPALLAGAALAWGAPTLGAEALLSGVWGYGPRSLSEAAAVPLKAQAPVLTVAWLYPSRGEAVRVEERRMSDERVELTPESLERLERFLQERRLRHVFAADALAAARRGWLLWWEAERALDAALFCVAGRAAPDYRRALELLRAGPLTEARLAKLRRLDEAATRSSQGFEGVTASQYIFEGFSAAYARFGLEEDARRWLYRIDNLWPVNDKRIEVTPIEDMRDGRIEGALLQDGQAVTDVRVGLFFAWRSTATASTHYFLSGSTFPDADGRFSFSALGPGRYHLALMGASERLGGRVRGSPGFIELGYDRPVALLAPIRLLPGAAEVDYEPPPAVEPAARADFLPVPGRKP